MRNQLVDEQLLKLLSLETSDCTKLEVVGQTVSHNYDERLNLAISNQVVHDESSLTLYRPAGFVLTPTVLQVQYWIALLLTLYHLAVTVRQINIGSLHLTSALAPEGYLLDVTMVDILAISVEVLILGRNLDTTLPTARTEVVVCTRIVKHATIDSQVIVVETRIHWALGSTSPNTILILAQYGTATATKTQAYNYRLSIGSLNTETGITLRVNHRILLTRLVH